MVSIVVWASRRRSKAIRLDAPKSMQKRMPGASTRMQVLKRPPEPNESPEPTKVTVVDMGVGFLAANDAHSRSPPVSISQRRTKITMKPDDGHDQDPAAAKLAIQCPRRSGRSSRRVRPTTVPRTAQAWAVRGTRPFGVAVEPRGYAP